MPDNSTKHMAQSEIKVFVSEFVIKIKWDADERWKRGFFNSFSASICARQRPI